MVRLRNLMYAKFITISCVIIIACSLCSCNFAPINNTNPKNDDRLNEDMLQSLGTLKRVDDQGKLYEMDVRGDYYSDEIKRIMEEANYIKGNFGCSVFLTHDEDGDEITCRNFDTSHSAKTPEDAEGVFVIYHCHQEGCYKSIGIADAKYCNEETASYKPGALDDSKSNISGIINGIYDPLDGVNERGLSVATLHSDVKKTDSGYTVSNPNLPSCVTGTLMRLMLDKCATVDEAIELAKGYNLIPYSGSAIEHIFISDASGNSKIIEWRNNEMRVANTDIGTNFYQTWNDAEPHKVNASKQYEIDSALSKTYNNYQYGYGHGYDRFNIIASSFQQYAQFENEQYSTRMTNELARNLLSVVAQQYASELTSMTQYSVIYNNDNLTADIWLSRDYSKKYSVSVDFK